ncbi:MAG: hypothetical protein PSX80_08615 [bacterium]|nr:hypothetical protein [bacterium]
MLTQNGCDQLREDFKEILLAENAPGGMVIFHNSDCAEVRDLDLSAIETDSLNERLDVLVKGLPSYGWRKRDGVVNVEPRGIKVELLETQVAYFAYKTSSNLDSVADSLIHTAEVRQVVANSNLLDGLYFGGLQSPPSKKPGTEVVLHNKSVRQILNDIVQRRKRGLWVYSEQIFDHRRTFTL